MKRRHKQAAGLVGTLGALAALVSAVDQFAAHRADDIREMVTAHSRVAQLEIQLCEAKGGRWWRGECEGARP